MSEHLKTGELGEKLALEFLVNAGYQILETGWRYKHKEIDIIAKDGDYLVFVEVKTRTENYWGNPEEFVTKSKQKFLIHAADAYINESDFNGESRFDIISVLLKNNNTEIEHITEAFYP